MATNRPSVALADVGESAPAKDSEPSLSLTQFCERLSETVRRPELIKAFHTVETTAGRTGSTASEFRSRFDAFINQPV